jgi:hypothetical protein
MQLLSRADPNMVAVARDISDVIPTNIVREVSDSFPAIEAREPQCALPGYLFFRFWALILLP